MNFIKSIVQFSGDKKHKNNTHRQFVLTIDTLVERHLYDFEEEEDIGDYEEIFEYLEDVIKITELDCINCEEDEDLNDIKMAIKLLFYKIHLMDTLGFKVVSQVIKYYKSGIT